MFADLLAHNILPLCWVLWRGLWLTGKPHDSKMPIVSHDLPFHFLCLDADMPYISYFSNILR